MSEAERKQRAFDEIANGDVLIVFSTKRQCWAAIRVHPFTGTGRDLPMDLLAAVEAATLAKESA